MKNNLFWYILVFITFMVWGTMHPLLKIVTEDVSVYVINFLRFFMALLVLLPFAFNKKHVPEMKDLFHIGIIGIIGIVGAGLFLIIGVKLSSATNSSILLNTTPILLAIAGPIFLKEHMNLKKFLGVLFGFLGVLIVISNGFNVSGLFTSDYFIGNLILLLGAICTGVYTILNKKFVLKYGEITTLFYSVLVAVLVLFIVLVFRGELGAIKNISELNFLMILYIAVFTTALTWIIRLNAIKRIGVVKMSTLFFLIPISGVISSHFILDEELSVFTLVGAIIIFVGIYVVQHAGKEAKLYK